MILCRLFQGIAFVWKIENLSISEWFFFQKLWCTYFYVWKPHIILVKLLQMIWPKISKNNHYHESNNFVQIFHLWYPLWYCYFTFRCHPHHTTDFILSNLLNIEKKKIFLKVNNTARESIDAMTKIHVKNQYQWYAS